jgi:hypothetical protein
MKTVEEVRRLRLAQLVAESGGGYAELNRKRGKDERDSTLSQYANQSPNSKGAKDGKPAKPKDMGSKLARALEKACEKPTGWMDTDPDEFWPFGFSPSCWREITERERHIIEGLVLSELRRLRGELGGGATDIGPSTPPRRAA